MDDLSQLERKIGLKFKNQDLLRQSLVHRSYLNEHPKFPLNHNERLEFLGDAVLEIIVTEYLYHQYPDKPEGELTNWRASLVNSNMLSSVAKDIELEEYIYLSKGEAKDKNSKARQFILANAVEAMIGSIYLDQGREAAEGFIHRFILSKLDNILENKLYLDAKSRFQEKAQECYGLTPHYKVLNEEGPDHDKRFEIGLFLGEEMIAKATGTSKQEGQVKAAAKGLEKKGWE
jgi:ribonuclease-3